MFNKMIDLEQVYAKQFCESKEDEDTISFWDNHIPDMYTHNFTLLKKKVDLNEILIKEINERRGRGFNFLILGMYHPVDEKILNSLPIKPTVSIYDYMFIETDKYVNLKGNEACEVKKADTLEVLEDGISVDILTNQAGMGNDFATRRIARKAQIYKQPESAVDLYVCYHNNIPIGNCELMVHNGMAKIEDFDILEAYQKKGFGTAVLRHLLEQAAAKTDIAYLITDQADTAKDMYKKCGFHKAGEKTELFFELNP